MTKVMASQTGENLNFQLGNTFALDADFTLGMGLAIMVLMDKEKTLFFALDLKPYAKKQYAS